MSHDRAHSALDWLGRTVVVLLSLVGALHLAHAFHLMPQHDGYQPARCQASNTDACSRGCT